MNSSGGEKDTQFYQEFSGKVCGRRLQATNSCTDESLPGLDGDITARRKHFVAYHQRTGIAFSGGGIRSATISLGLTEGLAAYGRFYAFDMMSTVSGGGYFGTFLRSLFIERGNKPDGQSEAAIISDRHLFADAVLKSIPDQQYFRGSTAGGGEADSRSASFIADGKTVKNPIWALRENGRYLAPNGMTDYNFAISYIVRNWFALTFTVLVALAMAFAALQLLTLGAREFFAAIGWNNVVASFVQPEHSKWPELSLSPFLKAIPLLMLVGAGFGSAYWMSVWMPYSKRKDGDVENHRDIEYNRFFGAYLLVIAITAIVLSAIFNANIRQDIVAKAMLWASAAILVFALLSSAAALLIARKSDRGSLSAEFRRTQTRFLSYVTLVCIGLLALGLVDTLALFLSNGPQGGSSFKAAAVSTAVVTALSWLVAKVPQWLSGSGFGIVKYLMAHSRIVALVTGVAMLASLAVMADLIVLEVLWKGAAWPADGQVDWNAFWLFLAATASLFLIIGRSGQFLNMTALTPLYSSRLSRSYLGATNPYRIDADEANDVTKGIFGDDLDLRSYMEADVAAPLHLANVTLNRTIGAQEKNPKVAWETDDTLITTGGARPVGRLASYESKLTLRDRHGDRVVFGPYGVRAGAEFHKWDDVEKTADHIPLGQLCAMSGAAVSSAMGRHTSLGSAMSFTLANVRLGQWWRSPVPADKVKTPLLPTYSHLYAELTASYDRKRSHWNLTDGGHSENTGALSLLERGCRFILVADNGEDPRFEFADLELFVRTARTDIGMEIDVLHRDQFPPGLSKKTKSMFLNGSLEDWRARAKSKADSGFALLLRARDILPVVSGKSDKRQKRPDATIVWLKPRAFSGLPSDIATYSELNPQFPQQSTVNQFFDEAQWESYRRIGFAMASALFRKPGEFADELPQIFQVGP